ncbi:MAG: bifunctional serine/threonine-protein kinase/formylglycine-generating enzyme family protein [Lacunisphaera sp.]|nr:bifunctional serine/threonine-protein kinase/formylglycine-generating enzyme family protein [Lacunisphaera sp.]
MDDLDLGATIKGFTAGQKVFGRYTLKKILGRGGMGVVWLAHDEELERATALKFLPEVVAADRAAIADMKREVRRAIDLAHPHIVKIHDFVTDGRTAAVSMEHIAGETLSSRRLDEPGQIFSVEKLGPWVAQLCAALDYAHHDAQIVHRDLKPTNLMLDARGRLKVLDFGIAASISDSVSRVSNKGSSSGTPVYMSPQQMMGEDPKVTDDIYSVGALLFELLAGKPPFHAGNILLQVQNKVAPLLNERRRLAGLAPVPVAWEETIAACLAKDPAARPQSAGEVAARLAGQLPAPITPPAAPVMPAPEPTPVPLAPAPAVQTPEAKGKRHLLFAAAGVVGLLVLGLVVLNRNREPAASSRPAPSVDTAAPVVAPAAAEPPAPGKPWTIPGLDLRLIPLAAGTFSLGAATGGEHEERPVTEVTLTKPFWLGRTEVTQRQWREIMLKDPAELKVKGDDLPVTDIWGLAMIDFCKKLTERERAAGRLPAGYVYSLPTEAQWEYAARAGSTADTVTDMDAVAWHAGNSGKVIHPVGQKRANAWGLQDMIGNAAELCLDNYTHYPGGKASDWTGYVNDSSAVLRGGYLNELKQNRVTTRYPFTVVQPTFHVSFRLALVPDDAVTAKLRNHAVLRQPKVGEPWTVGWISSIVLLPIAPGTFTMGSMDQRFFGWDGRDSSGYPSMRPLTEVTISQPFWLGQTEITQTQWHEIMGTTPAEQREKHKVIADANEDMGSGTGYDDPMYFVDWEEAMEFCRRLTKTHRENNWLPAGYEYTLPTEAQWEYAARAGSTADTPPDLGAVAWYGANDGGAVHPVAQKQANAWGLHDMLGNVSELCRDWEGDYAGGKVSDPTGPATGLTHIERGGGWGGHETYYFYPFRQSDGGGMVSSGVGFRLALAPVR